jgi:hypothetical protein
MKTEKQKTAEKVKNFGTFLGTLWVDKFGPVDFFEYKDVTWGLYKQDAFFANQLGDFYIKSNGISKEIEYIDN